jgi:ribose 5-phosphate isomerase B
MKIGLACDHAGFDFKEQLKTYLSSKGNEIDDYGCYSLKSVDYPEFAHKLAESIENNENKLGVQFCGTGNGINMSLNTHQGIRAALCWNPYIAEQARLHNNANILTMPARQLSWEEVEKIVDAFLSAEFEGGRHEIRVNKIKIKTKANTNNSFFIVFYFILILFTLISCLPPSNSALRKASTIFSTSSQLNWRAGIVNIFALLCSLACSAI